MELDIMIVIILNFIITVMGTLAYSVRMVGVRTGKIAVSAALFNAISLISRTAGAFQLPKLTKYVEESVKGVQNQNNNLLFLFHMLLLNVFIASIIGALLLPTFQRIFTRGVEAFSTDKSIFRLILHSFTKSGVKYIKNSVAIPTKTNFKGVSLKKLPKRILVYNMVTVALLTAGTFAPVYAGSLQPDLSGTCVTLSAVITGLATILLALFVDPYLSILTDEVIEGKYSEADYRGCVIGMVGSKIAGSVLSFAIFIPAAYLIVFIAKFI
ncbi:MAG: hypothetical protein K0R50_1381 [Eubacterium sp.]|nr:hypothetical protein [Eubacterium sp.]